MVQETKNEELIPNTELQILLKSIDEIILPREILEGIKSELMQSMTKEGIKALLLWYEFDTGKEITLAEERVSTAEANRQMMIEAPVLLTNAELMEFARRMVALVGATDIAMS